jgi:hypothetical protein
VSALDAVRAAMEKQTDPDRTLTLKLETMPVAIVLRPSSWADDKRSAGKIAEYFRTEPDKALDVAALHVAKHVLAIRGVGGDGQLSGLYDDGGDALLDQRLADELAVPFVSPAQLLRRLVGDTAMEQLWMAHSNWSVGDDKRQVTSLGE